MKFNIPEIDGCDRCQAEAATDGFAGTCQKMGQQWGLPSEGILPGYLITFHEGGHTNPRAAQIVAEYRSGQTGPGPLL